MFQQLNRAGRGNYTRGEYLRRFLWLFIQATLFRLPIPKGHAFRAMLLRMFGAKVGRPAGVSRTVSVMHPWLLTVGDWSMLGPDVAVYNLGPIAIGDHTLISQRVYLCAGTHDYAVANLPLQKPPIVIGSGVWVAAGAFVGPGVTIGDNAVVGACSVVVKDIPADVVAAGNPCRVIKPRIPSAT